MMNFPSSLQTGQLVPVKCPWALHWRSMNPMQVRLVQEPYGNKGVHC